MYLRARMCGLSPNEFWNELSLRELCREFVVSKRMTMERYDDTMMLAWTTAALVRCKKMPKLTEILSRKHIRRQTRLEQKAAMAMLSARYGIPIKKTQLIHVGDGQKQTT